MKRPGRNKFIVATPLDESMIELLGPALSQDGFAITRDQAKYMNKLYNFVPETKDNAKINNFMQAGADRNMFRHASSDGLRMVAWIAKYCEPEEDPVKVLIRMASDAGLDVDPSDFSWASGEEDADAEED